MYREFYSTFGLTNNFRSRLSIRSMDNKSKYKGSDVMWEKAEKMLEKALIDAGMEYYRGEGEAAFYGPKIDFQFKNLMGREETVSTIQVDFLSPMNFGLAYTDEQGHDQMPIILHRAPLSTHERFISFLLEYYGGAFPTWCAPVQVVVVPVNEECHAYGRALVEELHSKMVRAEIDESDNSFNKKIRNHTIRKVPVQLIIGLKEVEQNQVTIRRYGIQEQKTEGRDAFIEELLKEIKGRVMLREPMGSLL
jgi:threonyl-tRNA synthetase